MRSAILPGSLGLIVLVVACRENNPAYLEGADGAADGPLAGMVAGPGGASGAGDAGTAGSGGTPDAGAAGTAGAGTAGTAGAPTSLRVGLVGYWPFEDAGGTTTVADLTGQNPGVLRGAAPTVVRTEGKVGNGVAFAWNAWVEVPGSASLDAVRATFTLTAWVSPDSGTSGITAIASRAVAAITDEHYGLFLTGTNPFGYVRTDQVRDKNKTLPTAQWSHVAMTLDSNTARLWLNGAEIASVATARTPATDTTPMLIGANDDHDTGATPRFLFKGRIDEVGLWNRALTASELGRLAAAERP